ncbi:MAG: hypothetical protein H3C30_11680 [Candidatus Hydrogenedentes bacterium]|nr:hypothetical protein [Candidatus Hydrogenedentota bacterium]
MSKIKVQLDDGGFIFFDRDKALECWDEGAWWDGSNNISLATRSQWEHEILYKTSKGRYVLQSWSQWESTPDSYQILTPKEAAVWLLTNEHDVPADLSKHVDHLIE